MGGFVYPVALTDTGLPAGATASFRAGDGDRGIGHFHIDRIRITRYRRDVRDTDRYRH